MKSVTSPEQASLICKQLEVILNNGTRIETSHTK